MKEIISIINQKGGVGKSTTAFALGARLSLKGFKVLFVDMDAQGNLTDTLRADGERLTSDDLLKGDVSARDRVLDS
jgi:chromosome partitioning protein